MLDAMIASALKKLLTHVHFRKRESVEEQRERQPILTRETPCRSVSIFEPPELMKQFKVYLTCSVHGCKMMMSKFSMSDGIKLYIRQ